MHPDVKKTIFEICAGEKYEDVLEIGATDGSTMLLESPFEDSGRRVGIDLKSWEHPDLELYEANAHNLEMLESDAFDCVLCNAVLEHDPEFWKTLEEIYRVAAPNARVVIGVPGYSSRVERRPILEMLGISSAASDIDGPDKANQSGTTSGGQPTENAIYRTFNALPRRFQQVTADVYRYINRRDGPVGKIYGIHKSPGDYYRFSPQAVEEVFLRECTDFELYDILNPPRLIGTGKYTGN